MKLSWFRAPDVDQLIADGKWDRAIRRLEGLLDDEPENRRLRQLLGDLLARAGRTDEAIKILSRLADELATEGFFAKAVAVVKKMQRLAPDRGDLEVYLADLLMRQVAEDQANNGRSSVASLSGVARTPLFRDLDAEELVALVRGLALRNFAPGEIVFAEGELGHSLMLLASGTVRVYVANDRHVQREVRQLGAGSFFGEIAMIAEGPRTATITASEYCEVLELDRETVRSIVASHPRVRDVLRSFCLARADSIEERRARLTGIDNGGGDDEENLAAGR
ncbi:MAG: cyclic nucleotide-binding domain-containing protein [Acidobacteriota bacterium]